MNRKVLLQLFEMKGNSGDDSETEDFCLGTLFEEIEDLSEVSPNLKIQMAFAYMVWFIHSFSLLYCSETKDHTD